MTAVEIDDATLARLLDESDCDSFAEAADRACRFVADCENTDELLAMEGGDAE